MSAQIMFSLFSAIMSAQIMFSLFSAIFRTPHHSIVYNPSDTPYGNSDGSSDGNSDGNSDGSFAQFFQVSISVTGHGSSVP